VGVAPFKFASPGGAALTVLIWNSNLYESSLHMHAEHSGALLADTGTSFSAAAWAAFKSHPSVFSFLKMTAVKFCAIWHWFEIPDNTNFYYGRLEAPVLVWLPITFWVLASLGLAGLLLYLKSWRTLWPLYLAVCWSILPLWLVTPNSRYRQTLTVALIPFAAILLVRCCDWLLEKKYWNACKLGLVVLPLACWMLRPLPPNILIIRVADYVVPYQTFYRPRIEAAMQSKNWQRMEELVLDALHYEPEAIKNCDRAHPALSDIEAGLAEVFAWTHFAYYMCLNNLGRNEQATQEFERANELRFIINNRNPKP
jgi:hypothetical protein